MVNSEKKLTAIKFGPQNITMEGGQHRVRIEGLKSSNLYFFPAKQKKILEPPEGAPQNIRVNI